ncbi:MAG: glycoside hydrolase family 5 protein [Clostridiales bacterium]|nr:glycoside hydrolase family 5 protein [Clostridiales bacterium]
MRNPIFVVMAVVVIAAIAIAFNLLRNVAPGAASSAPVEAVTEPMDAPAPAPTIAPAPAFPKGSPADLYGRIQVGEIDGVRQLLDERGNPVQLRGMSTFGLQWAQGSFILTQKAFENVRDFMGADIIRLAMYVTEGGYASNPGLLLEKIEKAISMASSVGLYCIVDWHILTPGDPSDPAYLEAGVDLEQFKSIREEHPEYTGPQLFFAYLSKTYGSMPNLLFETANEPNGLGTEGSASRVWVEKLLPYHQSVTDAIRLYDNDLHPNIILCGTDSWSQLVDSPAGNEVKDPSGQIMYSIHFYAGTHDVSDNRLKTKIAKALNRGLAVFCTEWGTSQASGDKGPYTENSDKWLAYLEERNISWCNWSLGNKAESSAALKPIAPSSQDWDESHLTESGLYVRQKLLD